MARWDISGGWRGEYIYDPSEGVSDTPRVGFTLTARWGWFGRFVGTVQDDGTFGAKEPASVRGKVANLRVAFLKQYPQCYVSWSGSSVTLREQLKQESGLSLDYDIRPAPVRYRGEYNPVEDIVRGQWEVLAHNLVFRCSGKVMHIPIAAYRGTWTMRRQQFA